MSRLKKIHQRASTLFKGGAGNLDGLEEALTKLAEDPALCLVPAAWARPLFDLDPIRFAPFILEHADPRFIPKTQRDKLKDAVVQSLAQKPASEVTDARIFLVSSLSNPSTWTPNGDYILQNVEPLLLTPVDELASSLERKDPYHLPDVFACRLLKRHPEIAREWVLSTARRDPDIYSAADLPACNRRLLPKEETREDGEELFRRAAEGDAWHQVVTTLLNQPHSAEELVAQLERFQPLLFIKNGGRTVRRIVARRPGAALPWLQRNANKLRMDGFDTLLDALSEAEQWTLHDIIARHLAGQERYQQILTELAQNADPDHALPRLRTLSGGTHALHWSGIQDIKLTDETAVILYRRFPEVLFNEYSEQLQPTLRYDYTTKKTCELYPELFGAAANAKDTKLLDLLAGRALSLKRDPWSRLEGDEAEHITDHYGTLPPEHFAQRASNVFTSFSPAHAHHWYVYRRANPVYSVFFDAPDRYLVAPSVIPDFLESAQPAVRGLAWRVLDAGNETTTDQAGNNPQHLLAVPLDRLGPKDMAAALRVIAKSAAGDHWLAQLLLPRLRQMSSLYKPTFRREHLAHAMGQILRAHPDLRRTSEEPVIFEHTSMRST